ncbi:MAG TPA: T9SS type A sorting domain-containing protein [Chitinophagales bacterium]|nr:T9SS type A sorting domain-containing protein [Chitinophagales bacterium]
MKKHLLLLHLLVCFFLFSQTYAQSSFQNIVVGNIGNPNEPSIAISPTDTNNILVGTNTDKIFSSLDGGRTWLQRQATSAFGVFGDPCIIADSSGSFYYFHLARNSQISNWPMYADRIVCQRTNNGGGSWQVDSYTGNNVGRMQDKEWAALDMKNDILYVTWTQFDEYGSADAQDSSTIYFSKSDDGGNTWSNATLLTAISGDCLDSDNTIEGAMPAVGVNGEVYVTWAFDEKIYFNKSLNGGSTWSANEQVIANQPEGWDYEVDGLSRCNGLPVIMCDLSTGPYRGTVYINWTDKRNGLNDADVYIAKSIDGGDTWSAPIRVNDDAPGKDNFFSWMTIDQSNGDIYVVFNDRRNYNSDSTDVYMARSTDGGATFINYRVNQYAFNPSQGVFHGDYNNVSAVNGCVRPIWTRQDNGGTSVVTALVNFPQTISAVKNVSSDFKWRLVSSNPTKGNCIVAVEDVTGNASVEILDATGRLLCSRNAVQSGDFVKLNLAAFAPASGVYFIRCADEAGIHTFKVLLQ